MTSTELPLFGHDLKEIIGGHKLLQSGNIRNAREIEGVEYLESGDLEPIWNLVNKYLDVRPFAGISLTQFDTGLTSLFGAREDLSRIIYFSKVDYLKHPLAGGLILNPRIISPSKDTFYSLEGCGSIENAHLGMIIKRPRSIFIEGYFWEPGMAKPEEVHEFISGISSAITCHEIVHLDGRGATDSPEDLVDITYPLFEHWLKPVLTKSDSWENWLVYKDNRLMVVNSAGEYQRDFVK